MPAKTATLGPPRYTRLPKVDDRYLMKLAAKYQIKPGWYLRAAFIEWAKRDQDRRRNA